MCNVLNVKKLDARAKLPARAHFDDAGLDLYALRDIDVLPGEVVTIETGIAVEIPTGYVGLIWDKSSVGSKGKKVFGGVIDAQYRGDVSVLIGNLCGHTISFAAGQKVAQLLVQRIELPTVVEIDELSDTSRGIGGFGSSGGF